MVLGSMCDSVYHHLHNKINRFAWYLHPHTNLRKTQISGTVTNLPITIASWRIIGLQWLSFHSTENHQFYRIRDISQHHPTQWQKDFLLEHFFWLDNVGPRDVFLQTLSKGLGLDWSRLEGEKDLSGEMCIHANLPKTIKSPNHHSLSMTRRISMIVTPFDGRSSVLSNPHQT
jgi:hypothetical protein